MDTLVPAAPAARGFARTCAALAATLDRLQAPVALLMRLYVAKVFFWSGLLKLMRWDGTLALFENEFHVPLLAPHTAAVLGTATELVLPLFLALGFGTRAAALALFAFNAVAVISYPDLSDAGLKDHVLWGVLLLLTAVYGPGKLALERLLGRRQRRG